MNFLQRHKAGKKPQGKHISKINKSMLALHLKNSSEKAIQDFIDKILNKQ